MSKTFYGKDFELGILGGGQLGRMFIQEASNFNVSTAILDPSPHAPCAELASRFEVGNFRDYDAVYNFGKTVDLLTIEIEDVNIDALFKLEEEGLKIFPQPKVIQTIKDKGLQKQFYRINSIPTSAFSLVTGEELKNGYVPELPVVQKLRTGGYDGRGVQVLRNESDLENMFMEDSVFESLVDIDKEISVICARNEHGECTAYPAVELEFHPTANLVEFLVSPAGIDDSVEDEARALAMKTIEQFEMVGLLAVEMFLTKDGDLLVNEVAPRTHNSGHQTIEGNYCSQFEQHLRSIVGMPLGSTALISPSVMINLLGEDGKTGEAILEGLNEAVQIEGVYPHLYGKRETKPFRKMGHVTVLGETREAAHEKAINVKAILKVTA